MKEGMRSHVTKAPLNRPTSCSDADSQRQRRVDRDTADSIHITASELAPSPYMAPKDRSISPTTMTSVSPSDMIATELMARSTEMPTSTLNDFGLRTNIKSATRTIARTNPPMRNARSKVAWPVEAKLERAVSAEQGRGNQRWS